MYSDSIVTGDLGYFLAVWRSVLMLAPAASWHADYFLQPPLCIIITALLAGGGKLAGMHNNKVNTHAKAKLNTHTHTHQGSREPCRKTSHTGLWKVITLLTTVVLEPLSLNIKTSHCDKLRYLLFKASQLSHIEGHVCVWWGAANYISPCDRAASQTDKSTSCCHLEKLHHPRRWAFSPFRPHVSCSWWGKYPLTLESYRQQVQKQHISSVMA